MEKKGEMMQKKAEEKKEAAAEGMEKK